MARDFFFLKKSVRQETLNLSFFRDQHFGFKFHSKNAKQAHGVAPIVVPKDQLNCPMSIGDLKHLLTKFLLEK